MSQHLFTNVNVLDCTDSEPFAGEVRVEGNEITAIARDGESLDRAGAVSYTHLTLPTKA